MADVFDNISFIRTAQYGREVRTAIADSIEQCYAHATADPNSLASIVQKLFDGQFSGIGEVVEGVTSWGTNIDDIAPLTVTQLNSIYLKPGTWLLFYNTLFMPGTGDSTSPYVMWFTVSSIESSVPMNYSICRATDPDTLGTSYSGFYVATVTEEDATISDSDPDKDGTELYCLYVHHNGSLAASASSKLIAIKIKANSDDGTSLTEQVAENTAAIANLQTLDTDISSIRSQHANDIDELTDLIEDSVVSLRASLDEKTFSLDENDYLTLD